ncbi:hypothetical protein BB560_000863 [Smittium megazygosporum]|uniref:GDP/GTP exchange factor Sec2 N-terminal domain-containing protein n=1 Tax=Smittium megazygosporum TaxID=133381 RepID=A0A2T9ZJ32_9FUNG|nr:hypothetical protein BB560_000863 [Smittium megazygosporum]
MKSKFRAFRAVGGESDIESSDSDSSPGIVISSRTPNTKQHNSYSSQASNSTDKYAPPKSPSNPIPSLPSLRLQTSQATFNSFLPPVPRSSSPLMPSYSKFPDPSDLFSQKFDSIASTSKALLNDPFFNKSRTSNNTNSSLSNQFSSSLSKPQFNQADFGSFSKSVPTQKPIEKSSSNISNIKAFENKISSVEKLNAFLKKNPVKQFDLKKNIDINLPQPTPSLSYKPSLVSANPPLANKTSLVSVNPSQTTSLSPLSPLSPENTSFLNQKSFLHISLPFPPKNQNASQNLSSFPNDFKKARDSQSQKSISSKRSSFISLLPKQISKSFTNLKNLSQFSLSKSKNSKAKQKKRNSTSLLENLDHPAIKSKKSSESNTIKSRLKKTFSSIRKPFTSNGPSQPSSSKQRTLSPSASLLSKKSNHSYTPIKETLPNLIADPSRKKKTSHDTPAHAIQKTDTTRNKLRRKRLIPVILKHNTDQTVKNNILQSIFSKPNPQNTDELTHKYVPITVLDKTPDRPVDCLYINSTNTDLNLHYSFSPLEVSPVSPASQEFHQTTQTTRPNPPESTSPKNITQDSIPQKDITLNNINPYFKSEKSSSHAPLQNPSGGGSLFYPLQQKDNDLPQIPALNNSFTNNSNLDTVTNKPQPTPQSNVRDPNDGHILDPSQQNEPTTAERTSFPTSVSISSPSSSKFFSFRTKSLHLSHYLQDQEDTPSPIQPIQPTDSPSNTPSVLNMRPISAKSQLKSNDNPLKDVPPSPTMEPNNKHQGITNYNDLDLYNTKDPKLTENIEILTSLRKSTYSGFENRSFKSRTLNFDDENVQDHPSIDQLYQKFHLENTNLEDYSIQDSTLDDRKTTLFTDPNPLFATNDNDPLSNNSSYPRSRNKTINYSTIESQVSSSSRTQSNDSSASKYFDVPCFNHQSNLYQLQNNNISMPNGVSHPLENKKNRMETFKPSPLNQVYPSSSEPDSTSISEKTNSIRKRSPISSPSKKQFFTTDVDPSFIVKLRPSSGSRSESVSISSFEVNPDDTSATNKSTPTSSIELFIPSLNSVNRPRSKSIAPHSFKNGSPKHSISSTDPSTTTPPKSFSISKLMKAGLVSNPKDQIYQESLKNKSDSNYAIAQGNVHTVNGIVSSLTENKGQSQTAFSNSNTSNISNSTSEYQLLPNNISRYNRSLPPKPGETLAAQNQDSVMSSSLVPETSTNTDTSSTVSEKYKATPSSSLHFKIENQNNLPSNTKNLGLENNTLQIDQTQNPTGSISTGSSAAVSSISNVPSGRKADGNRDLNTNLNFSDPTKPTESAQTTQSQLDVKSATQFAISSKDNFEPDQLSHKTDRSTNHFGQFLDNLNDLKHQRSSPEDTNDSLNKEEKASFPPLSKDPSSDEKAPFVPAVFVNSVAAYVLESKKSFSSSPDLSKRKLVRSETEIVSHLDTYFSSDEEIELGRRRSAGSFALDFLPHSKRSGSHSYPGRRKSDLEKDIMLSMKKATPGANGITDRDSILSFESQKRLSVDSYLENNQDELKQKAIEKSLGIYKKSSIKGKANKSFVNNLFSFGSSNSNSNSNSKISEKNKNEKSINLKSLENSSVSLEKSSSLGTSSSKTGITGLPVEQDQSSRFGTMTSEKSETNKLSATKKAGSALNVLKNQTGEPVQRANGMFGKLGNMFSIDPDFEAEGGGDGLNGDPEFMLQKYKQLVQNMQRQLEYYIKRSKLLEGIVVELEQDLDEVDNEVAFLLEEKKDLESKLEVVNDEIHDLTSKLFSEANEMVKKERVLRHEAENRAEEYKQKLEQLVKENPNLLAGKRVSLDNLFIESDKADNYKKPLAESGEDNNNLETPTEGPSITDQEDKRFNFGTSNRNKASGNKDIKENLRVETNKMELAGNRELSTISTATRTTSWDVNSPTVFGSSKDTEDDQKFYTVKSKRNFIISQESSSINEEKFGKGGKATSFKSEESALKVDLPDYRDKVNSILSTLKPKHNGYTDHEEQVLEDKITYLRKYGSVSHKNGLKSSLNTSKNDEFLNNSHLGVGGRGLFADLHVNSQLPPRISSSLQRSLSRSSSIRSSRLAGLDKPSTFSKETSLPV